MAGVVDVGGIGSDKGGGVGAGVDQPIHSTPTSLASPGGALSYADPLSSDKGTGDDVPLGLGVLGAALRGLEPGVEGAEEAHVELGHSGADTGVSVSDGTPVSMPVGAPVSMPGVAQRGDETGDAGGAGAAPSAGARPFIIFNPEDLVRRMRRYAEEETYTRPSKSSAEGSISGHIDRASGPMSYGASEEDSSWYTKGGSSTLHALDLSYYFGRENIEVGDAGGFGLGALHDVLQPTGAPRNSQEGGDGAGATTTFDTLAAESRPPQVHDTWGTLGAKLEELYPAQPKGPRPKRHSGGSGRYDGSGRTEQVSVIVAGKGVAHVPDRFVDDLLFNAFQDEDDTPTSFHESEASGAHASTSAHEPSSAPASSSASVSASAAAASAAASGTASSSEYGVPSKAAGSSTVGVGYTIPAANGVGVPLATSTTHMVPTAPFPSSEAPYQPSRSPHTTQVLSRVAGRASDKEFAIFGPRGDGRRRSASASTLNIGATKALSHAMSTSKLLTSIAVEGTKPFRNSPDKYRLPPVAKGPKTRLPDVGSPLGKQPLPPTTPSAKQVERGRDEANAKPTRFETDPGPRSPDKVKRSPHTSGNPSSPTLHPSSPGDSPPMLPAGEVMTHTARHTAADESDQKQGGAQITKKKKPGFFSCLLCGGGRDSAVAPS